MHSVAQFLDEYDPLPLDVLAADHAADIAAVLAAVGTPIGPIDTLIAGIARSRGSILVTRNAREFSRVPGLMIEDWY
jgi:tRNA(fMet)-specific endonuclease VapC